MPEDLTYRLLRYTVLMMAGHGLPLEDALRETAGNAGQAPAVPGAPGLAKTRALVAVAMQDEALMARVFRDVLGTLRAHGQGPVSLDDVIGCYRKAAGVRS